MRDASIPQRQRIAEYLLCTNLTSGASLILCTTLPAQVGDLVAVQRGPDVVLELFIGQAILGVVLPSLTTAPQTERVICQSD